MLPAGDSRTCGAPMRLASALLVLAVACSPAVAQTGTPISVPSDPKARYWMVEGKRTSPTTVEVMTRREGPSGTSYALRQVDCANSRFRYLGEGDTLAEAKVRKTSDPMGPLTPQSISTYVSNFACTNIK